MSKEITLGEFIKNNPSIAEQYETISLTLPSRMIESAKKVRERLDNYITDKGYDWCEDDLLLWDGNSITGLDFIFLRSMSELDFPDHLVKRTSQLLDDLDKFRKNPEGI